MAEMTDREVMEGAKCLLDLNALYNSHCGALQDYDCIGLQEAEDLLSSQLAGDEPPPETLELLARVRDLRKRYR